VIKKLLESIGYISVLLVQNGLECLNVLRNETIHVVLMDIMMPEMSGMEATIQIRKEFPISRQPYIMALTANAFIEDKYRYLECGINVVLTKPINRNLLRDELDKLLNSNGQSPLLSSTCDHSRP